MGKHITHKWIRRIVRCPYGCERAFSIAVCSVCQILESEIKQPNRQVKATSKTVPCVYCGKPMHQDRKGVWVDSAGKVDVWALEGNILRFSHYHRISMTAGKLGAIKPLSDKKAGDQ